MQQTIEESCLKFSIIFAGFCLKIMLKIRKEYRIRKLGKSNSICFQKVKRIFVLPWYKYILLFALFCPLCLGPNTINVVDFKNRYRYQFWKYVRYQGIVLMNQGSFFMVWNSPECRLYLICSEREIWDLEKDKYHVMLAVGRTNEGLLEMHAQKVIIKIQLHGFFVLQIPEQLVAEFNVLEVLFGPASRTDLDLLLFFRIRILLSTVLLKVLNRNQNRIEINSC
jgi:hypothetical protein